MWRSKSRALECILGALLSWYFMISVISSSWCEVELSIGSWLIDSVRIGIFVWALKISECTGFALLNFDVSKVGLEGLKRLMRWSLPKVLLAVNPGYHFGFLLWLKIMILFWVGQSSSPKRSTGSSHFLHQFLNLPLKLTNQILPFLLFWKQLIIKFFHGFVLLLNDSFELLVLMFEFEDLLA